MALPSARSGNAVFIDTAGWIGLFNRSDGLHAQAQSVYASLVRQKAKLVTTELVLIEVADALCAPALRARTVAAVSRLRQGVIQIIPVTEMLLSQGWALYSDRPDKEWGLTDCTSFVVMQQAGIYQALTSDHHFTQAGFTCLL